MQVRSIVIEEKIFISSQKKFFLRFGKCAPLRNLKTLKKMEKLQVCSTGTEEKNFFYSKKKNFSDSDNCAPSNYSFIKFKPKKNSNSPVNF